MPDPWLGKQVGRYRLERLLGAGGMGRVYLGVHAALGSRVAVKFLADEHAGSPELVQRFIDEARAVTSIHHEAIVGVIDHDRTPQGTPFLVMEYVEGQTLRALVRGVAIPLGGLARLGVEVLHALDATHAVGIVHRDLKPDNIMVTPSGRAKILDFGIAKLAVPTAEGGPARTRTGVAIGTPQYMAPEQILGSAVDARTDLYAFGVVLFEAMTGVRPYDGTSDYLVMEGHLRAAIPDPTSHRPDLPAPLAAVIRQALAKAPVERFQSAKAFARALQAASAGLSIEDWQPFASRAWIASQGTDAAESASLPTVGDGPQKHERPADAPTRHERPRTTRPGRERSRRPVVLLGAVFGVAIAAVTGVAIWSRASPKREEQPVIAAGGDAAGGDAAGAPVQRDSRSVLDARAPSSDLDASNALGGKANPYADPHNSYDDHPENPPGPDASLDPFPSGIDPTELDGIAVLPEVMKRVRAIAPDMELVAMGFTKVGRDGHQDLTVEGTYATYDFRSATQSTRRPAGADWFACLANVRIDHTGIATTPIRSANCGEETIAPPACDMAYLWKSAMARGHDPLLPADISWWSDAAYTISFTQSGGNRSVFDAQCQR